MTKAADALECSPAKRPRLAPLLERCGLATKALGSSGGEPQTAADCRRLCLQLLERIELQREVTRLIDESGTLRQEMERKQADVKVLEAKVRARQLLEEVRTQVDHALTDVNNLEEGS
eukprot:gnl/TRDRNA2_/TRDRNA2_190909_c0_seq1.p1 gnl/TRDRNA2_/TRDRNA2_190909_c0~~gnl/TRDRNA2_/TRDRNA2_190909_c0_seq1.p1  ORF type:complete len:118 (-),score=33.51 gnl/TRDRNA2_/TRDRNA2_190909_c0_seq1:90-443(-)